MRGRNALEFNEQLGRGEPSIGTDRTVLTDGSRSAVSRPEADQLAHWGTLLAPGAMSTFYAGGAVLLSTESFASAGNGLGTAVSFGSLGLLLLVAGFSTARLYTDATREAARPSSWSPNPWRYIVGGGAALLALWLVYVVALGSGTVVSISVAGAAIVSLGLASIIAGPLYLVQRLRRTDRSQGGRLSERLETRV